MRIFLINKGKFAKMVPFLYLILRLYSEIEEKHKKPTLICTRSAKNEKNLKKSLLFSCVFIFGLGLFMLIYKIGRSFDLYLVFKNCPYYSASDFNFVFTHSIDSLVSIEVHVYPPLF